MALCKDVYWDIAGDENQLRPFDLFKIKTEEDDHMEDHDVDDTLLSESLLILAKRIYGRSYLSWHYRSKYQYPLKRENNRYQRMNLLVRLHWLPRQRHKVLIFRCTCIARLRRNKHRDMSNKKDESSGDDEPDQDRYQQKKRNQPGVKESVEKEFVIKSNTLDEGTMVFIHWLNSTHKYSTFENPIVVKSFENDKCTVLWDRDKQTEVRVDIKDGVPICQYCKADDCAHVGFTICLEQLHGRGQTLESIEAEAETSRTWGYYLCICFIASHVFFS